MEASCVIQIAGYLREKYSGDLMHGFPVLICSRKATWIGMPCTVWVWKRFYDEGNMEKKQQRKHTGETDPGNKVEKNTVRLITNTVSKCKNPSATALLHTFYWNSEGFVLQHINMYAHENVTSTCTSHTEAHIDGHKAKNSNFLCNFNSSSIKLISQTASAWMVLACRCLDQLFSSVPSVVQLTQSVFGSCLWVGDRPDW